MKSEGSVKHKLKQVKYRNIQKAIRTSLSKRPCNCKHSGLVKGSNGDDIFYVCMLDAEKPKEWGGMICDSGVPPRCPFFESFKTKEDIEADIERLLESNDIGKIASEYPDIMALLWVLGDDSLEDLTQPTKDEKETNKKDDEPTNDE